MRDMGYALSVRRAIAGALIAAQVKAHAVGESIHREVLFHIPRVKVLA